MVESVIYFLIWLLILAMVFYLVLYVVRDVIGIPIPPKVLQIFLVIVGLLVILALYQLLVGGGLAIPHFRSS